MPSAIVFEQSVTIETTATIVERCFTDLTLMHRWLNPMLQCEPVGEQWSTELDSKSRFILKIPLIKPSLSCLVVTREPGLIVWQFEGFFQGRDRWQFQACNHSTLLINTFSFQIPNPVVNWGFNQFAAKLTKQDMEAQLLRIKHLAEELKIYRFNE